VGSVSGGERGAVLTAMCCVTPASNCVSSVLIFEGADKKDEIRAADYLEAPLQKSRKYFHCQRAVLCLGVSFDQLSILIKANIVVLRIGGHTGHTKNLDSGIGKWTRFVSQFLLIHISQKIHPLDLLLLYGRNG
jgi:hypothetical protein